jgi:citrate synthase
MSEKATLSYGGKTLELPVIKGTEGEIAIDIAKLRAATGLITIDPGFMNTGSCQSSVTFIDGDQGILRYRGYPIEQLAEKSTFLEVSYLLLHGELPTQKQLAEFTQHVTRHTMLQEDIKRFYAGFRKDAHPMAVAAAVVGALSAMLTNDVVCVAFAPPLVDVCTRRGLDPVPFLTQPHPTPVHHAHPPRCAPFPSKRLPAVPRRLEVVVLPDPLPTDTFLPVHFTSSPGRQTPRTG